MSSSDDYDEDAPRPRRRKRSEEPESQDYEEASPPPAPRRKRSPRLADEDEQPVRESKSPQNKTVEKKPRGKTAQAPAKPATRGKSAKQEKPKTQPVNRGKWRNATLHERVLRIRWIMGLLYRYAPVWLVFLILIALFGPNLLRSMRNGL